MWGGGLGARRAVALQASSEAAVDEEMQQLTLVPNKKEYEPGEVAEILVQSPFTGAQALITLERHGVVSRQMLDLSTGSATLRVPLDEGYLPNLSVTVDAVGQEARTVFRPVAD